MPWLVSSRGSWGWQSADEQVGIDEVGITVSYWVDDDAARTWKQVAEHLAAQRRGQEQWYETYRVRVATVHRDYGPWPQVGDGLATNAPTSDDVRAPYFVDTDLRGARFIRADLSGVVMRAVDVAGADIDAPWLSDGGGSLLINGVDVGAFVESELNDRFPGRSDRRADHPASLRSAWAALERTWAATFERVAAMPGGTVDVSVAGEWSFAQTLQHLVMATDTWLGRAIGEIEQPFHPLGVPNAECTTDGNDMSVFTTRTPTWPEVLEVRAGRGAMVRDFLATVTADELAETRKNPWGPDHPRPYVRVGT